ncbi:MAG TPA: hypothetical protein PLP23_08805 [Panacibacter sp.]|nr:hypothetical protein [Panacibacter sp.]
METEKEEIQTQRELYNNFIKQKKKERDQKIWSGLALCIFGIFFTIINPYVYWWGAIVFGAIRFFKGIGEDIGEEITEEEITEHINKEIANTQVEKTAGEIAIEKQEIEHTNIEDEKFNKLQSNIVKVVVGAIILFVLFRLSQQLLK